jgi:hypothetical protein
MGGIRAVTAATALAVVAAVLGVPAGPAAAAPIPTIALPPQIDNAAYYEKQTACDPTPRPGTAALAGLLVSTYGPATTYISRACSSSTSEHFDGRALDWMRSVRNDAERAQVEDFLAWVLAPGADGTPQEMARRMGIMYIIWNNQMIRMYDPGRGWTNYNNCMDPARSNAGLDTSCHRNHVHISMSWDGAAALTSWWTGRAQTLPLCSARSTSAAPGAGTPVAVADPSTLPGFVPVAATTVLDTAAGVGGTLGGACRMLAGRSLFPAAAPAGLVPATAAAVALSVTSSSNAPASLSAWSSGAARPSGQVSTPIGTTTATVVVPLASDRTIGLGTSLGAAAVSARVVGYFAQMAGAPAAPSATAQDPAPPAAKRPSKPRSVKAKSAKGSRAVRTKWKKAKSAGSAAITGYRVEALTSRKKGASVAGSCTAGPTQRSCTITGLKKRKKYWMSVSVWNDAGGTWAKRKKVRVR